MMTAKLMIHVVIGLAPDMPINERCRAWSYTSEDMADDKASHEAGLPIFARLCDEATAYARSQMDPYSTNYVRLECVWL